MKKQRGFLDNKGVILIISFLVIVVLSALSAGMISRLITESRASSRYKELTQAFYLAEAGIAEARTKFPQSPLSGYLVDTNSTYSTVTSLISGFTDNYTITSSGSVSSGISRTIQVAVRQPQFGSINDVITTTGTLNTTGSATITGTVSQSASFSFQGIFNMTEDEVKAQANHFYTDPPNNVLPVDGITWVEVPSGNQLLISDNLWNGSGLLIVKGDLKISGGDFSGIIWVTGNVDMISGNPNINGSIFVDSGANETKITGNAAITYDASAISGALDNFSPVILSWQEL